MLYPDEIASELPSNGKEIWTPDGWRAIKKVYRTVPMRVWYLRTRSYELECSGYHLVRSGDNWSYVCDLNVGDVVNTVTGMERVEKIYDTDEEHQLYDIEVDHPDGMYYSDGILSHNSTTICARQLILSHIIKQYRGLYVAPSFPMMETYAARYQEMEAVFRTPTGKQNKYSKTYSNNSKLDFAYCLESARDVRGKSVEEITVDECVSYDTILLRRGDNLGADLPTRICDIAVGDYVVSFTDEGSKTYDRVTAKQCKGMRECYVLRTESGRSIKVTGNHRVFTNQGKLYVSEVRDRLLGEEQKSSPETTRIFCVPGRGLSEEKDGKPSCKIACEEEGGEALRYEEVVEVVPCGVMPVYDITTERTHRFLADGMLVSNCQNLNPDILPEILYTQTMAKLPMTIYTGTALTTDTLLEQKWRESSMGMWHVRAMDDKHWLNMCDKDVLAKVCDNPLGPICPYTGKRLKVARGSFVHANRQAMEAGNIGLHIPQCIITDIADSPVQWGKVYNHIKHDDWNKVLQECFGIAVEEGTREISQQDLLRACVLKDTQEGLKLKCNRGYYRLIISGCDWGGSDYNPSTKTKTSYTVHCIMGVAPDGGVDIVHYRRYSGMNYPEIARQIAIDHRAYNGQVIASDFGVGMAYNFEIRKYFPLDRHFIMEYTNPWAPAISLPKGAHMHNQLLINRTEALTNVFRDLKRPVPMIRCRCWEDMSPYLLDWLNMFRVVQESTSGKKSFLYRRPPTKADDALHAFTFAYVLVKFYRGESLIDDSNLVQRINAVLRSPRRESPTVQEFTRSVLGDMPWSIPIN